MSMEELVQEKLRQAFRDESIVFDKSRFAGGLTNYNYIMNINGVDYVIRQPGGMTDQIIDRKIERINNLLASEFGVNSDCVYFDESSGIKISTYVKNSRNMALADPSLPHNLESVSSLMKQIHSFPSHFPNRFDWLSELLKYEQIIKQLHGSFFFDYINLKEQLVSFIQKTIKSTILAPCHNDTVPENFLIDDKGRTYLVDWEYSGMNDPCWDVAAYILESKLPDEAIQQLVQFYFNRQLTPMEELKIKSFMMAQDLLWTAWALIRHYNGDDFLEYCCIRYDRFRKNIKAMTNSPQWSLASMVTS
ncbi:putative choline kinase involved in LPS biosynthesis [Desulfosporosinus orientis DSM 765]|uniref:Putative choline kinase involved in LPS biosynthesis n=1 Tax=Desulfosporosinus orientis (strain ATCC 19365 / DSM 765 / NCIMB 8382 / VKM B-1628 / Singapore I) TaxID=768706 RepID=G7WEI7_DESOD|nr:choline kinase family protein [Desulfosporosinus orientis]AET70800.1 putative choline kinase involved in LPS biosynthesis [Desulfosporosinus orientis DSM 765]